MKGKVVLFIMRVFASLPLGVNRFMGGLLGRMILLFNTREVKVTRENLLRCFPDKTVEERQELTRKSVLETAKLAFEIPWVWHASNFLLKESIVHINGGGKVEASLAQQKGLIVLAPHLGNWEVIGRVLTDYGKLTSLYRPPKQAFLDPLIRKSREQDGAALVPTTARGVAKLLSALKNGAISGILPDQCPGGEGGGVLSEFFSHPAQTITLVHGLVQRTNCHVLMAYAERVDGGFVVNFVDANEGIYSKDIEQSVLAMNASIEGCVLHIPEQYQWEYKRFKGIDSGDTRPYRF